MNEGMFRRVCVLVCLLATGGCATWDRTQNGAAVGSGLGALTGAIIGNQSGKAKEGALVGAVAGALGGGMLGQNQQLKHERNVAHAHAYHTELARQADARALTNADVITQVRNGVSDQLIVSQIHSRGGRFLTDSQSIITLKENGVSDAVIQEMLKHPAR